MSVTQVEKGGEKSSQKSSELEVVMYEDKDYVLHCYCQGVRAGSVAGGDVGDHFRRKSSKSILCARTGWKLKERRVFIVLVIE